MTAIGPSDVAERALAALGHAVIITDLHGRVTYWNTAAVALYGYTSEEALGSLAVELIVPPEYQDYVMQHGARVFEGEPFATDWDLRDKHGRVVTVHATTTVIRGDDGEPIATLSASYDVTADRALEVRASQLAALVDGSADAIILTDLSGCIQDANAAVAAVFDYTPEEMIGQDMELLVPADRMPELRDVVAAIKADRPCGTLTTVRLRKDGSTFAAEVRASPVRDTDGTLVGVSGITRDVTEDLSNRTMLEASESRYRARFERSGMPQAVLDLDGVIVTANEALGRLLGRDLVDVIGHDSQEFRHVSDCGGERVVRSVAHGWSDAETWERVLSRGDGTAVPVVIQACSLRDADGQAYALDCFMQDISGMHQAQQELRASEASYRAIVETAEEGIWTADPLGRTVYANGKLARILGLGLDVILAGTVPGLLGGADGGTFLTEQLRTRQERGAEQYEVVYPHPDGVERVLRLSVSPLRDDTGASGSLAMITDITDERRSEEQLRRQALYDDLTGLPNRTLLADRLQLAVARSLRTRVSSVAVLFADLDQFNHVNDSWGHDVGDQLLVAIGHRLSSAVRAGDTVGRFGGDEFVIIRERATEVEAQELAARLHEALAEPFDVGGQRSYMTASIGVAVSAPSSPEELLRFASAAMYEAKSHGPGRVRLFDVRQADHANGQMSLSNDLREALATDGLDLYYQPLVELSTGLLLGVEALARWQHPTRGAVSPVEFVRLAESMGLAATLDEWALSRACRDLARLRAAAGPTLRMSVNLSASHLADAGLEESVILTLRRHRLECSSLELEITESAIMSDPEHSRQLLQRLRDQGVDVAIDDFGTGYSSLGYLSRLPATTVKIDRSFVSSITEDPDSLAIVASIIDLCRAMRLATVAEGIETVEQLTLLHRLGCTAGQGFLWSPALPLDRFEQRLAELPNQRFDVTRISQYPFAPRRTDPAPPVLQAARGRALAAGFQTGRLSVRELEIVTRLSRGKRVPAIAAELYLTQGTVRNQLSSVYRKLGVRSQQDLLDLIHAQPTGLQPIDDGTRTPG